MRVKECYGVLLKLRLYDCLQTTQPKMNAFQTTEGVGIRHGMKMRKKEEDRNERLKDICCGTK